MDKLLQDKSMKSKSWTLKCVYIFIWVYFCNPSPLMIQRLHIHPWVQNWSNTRQDWFLWISTIFIFCQCSPNMRPEPELVKGLKRLKSSLKNWPKSIFLAISEFGLIWPDTWIYITVCWGLSDPIFCCHL